MNDITISTALRGNTVVVKLSGRMSENAEYREIQELLVADAVEFDFEGVTLINSRGIQVWKTFMTNLPNGLIISYVNCTLRVINQINLFPAFTGNKKVTIKNFFAPYACDACDVQTQVLLETDRQFPDPRSLVAPKVKCSSCGKDMEFDANSQKYFLFIRRSA